MSEKGPDFGRRWLFTRAIPGAAVATTAALTGARSAFAQGVLDVLCSDGKSIPAIDSTCDLPAANELEKNTFLHYSRSTAAFVELANYLPAFMSFPDRKLKCLYPAAGPHVAPLFMVSQLMDNDQINSAEFIYTEISAACLEHLLWVLQNMHEFDKNFAYIGSNEEKNDDGVVKTVTYTVNYRNKPIKITFKVNDPDKIDWFEADDLSKSDLYISHDATYVLSTMLRVFKIMKSKGDRKKTLIVEDLTNVRALNEDMGIDAIPLAGSFKRQFDMTLLGKIQRSTRPYGHRRMVKNHDAKDSHVEAGENRYKNGAIMNIHPQLFDLSLDEFSTFIDIDLAAVYDEINKLGNERHKNAYLKSHQTVLDIAQHAPKILQTLKSINKSLHGGFVVRLLQALSRLVEEVADYIFINFNNSDDGFAQIFSFFDLAKSIPQIDKLRAVFSRLQKEIYPKLLILEGERKVARETPEYDNFPRLEELSQDYDNAITKLRDEAEKISNSLNPLAVELMEKGNAM